MKTSRNSKISNSKVVVVSRRTAQASSIPARKQHRRQTNPTAKSSSVKPTESTRCHSLWKLLGGLAIVVLFCIAIVIPFIIISYGSTSDKSTTSSDFTSYLSTTLIVTTVTYLSTTTSTATTTSNSLRWNTTGITIAGQVNATSATVYYLNNPIGLVFDSSDTLYVADSNNDRIQQFFVSNPNGTTMAGASNGVSGSTANRLNFPNDVAIDSNGNLYIADTNNNRVQMWHVNASLGVTVAGNGTAGSSVTQLDTPYGIAFDSNTNTFYVSDSQNHRVMKYTVNSTVGTVVAGGNGSGKNTSQLYIPRGLYFDSSTNSLVIANYGAHNIVRWVIGALNWTLVAGHSNGSSGNEPTALYYPADVTLDSMGNVYVADRANHRIQFFLAGQMNGTTIAGLTSQSGNSSTALNRPLSIELDSALNLYVADTFNNRIQVFARS